MGGGAEGTATGTNPGGPIACGDPTGSDSAGDGEVGGVWNVGDATATTGTSAVIPPQGWVPKVY